MKQKLATLFLAIFLFARVFACINTETNALKDGTILFQDPESNVPYGHEFPADNILKSALLRMDSLYRATGEIDYLSDKGIVLILLKRYDEAIQLYVDIEKKSPNRYSTAANLGTAYELAGQTENALRWIKRAVAINPGSHHGSEWIHINILEAKLKGEQFYTTQFLLKTDFGSDNLPVTTLGGEKLETLSSSLFYQLNERMSFVKPKDRIIAQLLFDLGNTAFLQGQYADARADYQLAKDYGFADKLIDTRISETRAAQMPRPINQAGSEQSLSTKLYKNRRLVAIAFGIVFAAVLFFVRKKRETH